MPERNRLYAVRDGEQRLHTRKKFADRRCGVTSSFYQQVINTTGAAEREFHFNVQNTGSLACLGTVLLNYMD